ncbi:hypothetical protein NKF06_03590 [Haloferax sp. AB510]|uniref:hypothetical protein n=1 Tax=Haloferax sp. AB510 TaxID=2934172 RepID=UPI00209BED0C|nr:hypothetical protein [Haloferax sp. AB510]MCO8265689.1 hypothetical protein [Haloferax sp. AB510]
MFDFPRTFVLVAQARHPLFDGGRLAVETDGHDDYQLAVFELLVVELAEEVPGSLPDDLLSPGVAVLTRERVNAFRKPLRLGDADAGLIVTLPVIL